MNLYENRKIYIGCQLLFGVHDIEKNIHRQHVSSAPKKCRDASLQQRHNVMASQITDVSTVCPNICSGADKRKHQSSASLAFEGESTPDRWIPLPKGK